MAGPLRALGSAGGRCRRQHGTQLSGDARSVVCDTPGVASVKCPARAVYTGRVERASVFRALCILPISSDGDMRQTRIVRLGQSRKVRDLVLAAACDQLSVRLSEDITLLCLVDSETAA